MILWFTLVQVGLAVLAGLVAVGAGLIGRRPGDVTVGSLALIELLLIVQIVVAIIAPFAGNPRRAVCSSSGPTSCPRPSCRSRASHGRFSSAAAGAPSSWASRPSRWP